MNLELNQFFQTAIVMNLKLIFGFPMIREGYFKCSLADLFSMEIKRPNWFRWFLKIGPLGWRCWCKISPPQPVPGHVRAADPCGCTLQTGRLCRGKCWTWGTVVGWGGAKTSRTPLGGPLGLRVFRPQCFPCLCCCSCLPTDLQQRGKKLHNLWLCASIAKIVS